MCALVDETVLAREPKDCAPPRIKPASTAAIRAQLRTGRTVWCPGCSNGIITRAIVDAVLGLGLPQDKVAVFAGIGCSGRIGNYLNYSTVHTAHGRALPFATGAKVADSSLKVIVVMGDGDCAAIGGNHLIHAARRNVDLTAVVFNNSIYGMTGGQKSPTTHMGDRSTTSIWGNAEPAFDLCELARAAGATYVARGTSWAYRQLVELIAGGLVHEGFSFVEAMAVCHTYYGRFNLTADPAKFLLAQKEHAIPADEFEPGEPRRRDRYPVGVLSHVERPPYSDVYAERHARPPEGAARETGGPAQEESGVAQEAGGPKGREPQHGGAPAARLEAGRIEVRVSGSGGQGILLAAAVLADAVAAMGLEVVQTQSYGPEARGGASQADVIASAEEIDYPEVDEADVSLCLSQAAFDRYAAETRKGGLILYDSGLVQACAIPGVRLVGLPFTDTAVCDLGAKVVTNIVSLGALSAFIDWLPPAVVDGAVAARVPAKFKDLNLRALEAGRRLAERALAEGAAGGPDVAGGAGVARER